MYEERRAGYGDMMSLLQDIRDHQLTEAKENGLMRGDINAVTARVTSIEHSQVRQWWFSSISALVFSVLHLWKHLTGAA